MGNELSRLYDFEGNEMQGGLCWQVRNATKNNQKMTVFFTQKSPNDPICVLLKKEVSILLKLRHPNILHVQQPPTNVIGFTSELIKIPLFMAHQLSPVERLDCLVQISTAIKFLHENAKLIHNCINPYNIYMSHNFQFKLAGFHCANFMQYSTDQLQTQEYNASTNNMHIEYCSPEFIIDHQIATTNDDYSFGMLLAFLFGKPPPHCDGNLLTYKHFSGNMAPFVQQLPLDIQPLVQQTTAAAIVRISHSQCLLDSLFTDNVALQCLNTLDSINTISLVDKAKFFKALNQQQSVLFQQFPSELILNKCFPVFQDQLLKEIQLSVFIIPIIMQIIELHGHANDIESLLSHFQQICTLAYPATARHAFLSKFMVLRKARPFFYKSSLIPLLFNCLECQEEETTLLVFELLNDVELLKLIDYTIIKRLILKKANIYLQQSTGIKVQFMHLIELLIVHHIIDESLIQEMLELIMGMKDVPLSICKLFLDLQTHIPIQWYINLILPNMIQQVYYCTNQKDLEVCFEYFSQCHVRIKHEKMKKLPLEPVNKRQQQTVIKQQPITPASNKSSSFTSVEKQTTMQPILQKQPSMTPPVVQSKTEEFSAFSSAPLEKNPFEEEQSFGGFQNVLKNQLDKKDYKDFDPFH